MNYCTYCNCYFSENILHHLSSKTHKENVLKSRVVRSTFNDYKDYIEKRFIPEEEYKVVTKMGKLELSDHDYKKLERYLLKRRNRLGGEKYGKFRRYKIKAFS